MLMFQIYEKRAEDIFENLLSSLYNDSITLCTYDSISNVHIDRKRSDFSCTSFKNFSSTEINIKPSLFSFLLKDPLKVEYEFVFVSVI